MCSNYWTICSCGQPHYWGCGWSSPSTTPAPRPIDLEEEWKVHYHLPTWIVKTFLFLHGIGEFRFKAVKSSYLAEGMVPHVHKHTGLVSHNTLVPWDVHTNHSQVHSTVCWGKFTWSHTWLQHKNPALQYYKEGCLEALPGHFCHSWWGRLHIQLQLLATVFTSSLSLKVWPFYKRTFSFFVHGC